MHLGDLLRLLATLVACKVSSRRNLTTSVCPFLQANINAVLPKSSFAFISILMFEMRREQFNNMVVSILASHHENSLSIIVSCIKLNLS